jgi:uncharacterized membrane protein YqhA
MLRTVFAATRYVILIPVIGTLIAAVLDMVYAGVIVIAAVLDALDSPVSRDEAKDLAITSVEVIDYFLLGTVLYLISLGLYTLFIDSEITLPSWLHVSTLDDLKGKLVNVVIVILAVTFLGKVVEWKTGADIVYLGLGIGAVFLGLAALLWVGVLGNRRARNNDSSTGESSH